MNFELVSDYQPTGDQPEAIAQLTEGVKSGDFPSAIAATVIAVVLAWNGLPLIVVALAASGTALLASLIEQWI